MRMIYAAVSGGKRQRSETVLLEGTWEQREIWGEVKSADRREYSSSKRQTRSCLAKQTHLTTSAGLEWITIDPEFSSSHPGMKAAPDMTVIHFPQLISIPVFLFTVIAGRIGVAASTCPLYFCSLSESNVVISCLRFMPLLWTLHVDSYFWQGN